MIKFMKLFPKMENQDKFNYPVSSQSTIISDIRGTKFGRISQQF